MGLASTAADDVVAHHKDKMQMIGHDDIVLHLHHCVVRLDAVQQLLLYHLSHLAKHHPRRLWVAVGLAGIARKPS